MNISDIVDITLVYIIKEPFESLLVVFSLCTLFLDTKERIAARILTFPKVLLYIYVYTHKHLYAKVIYSIVYGIVNIYGYYNWKEKLTTPHLTISKTPIKMLAAFIGIGTISTMLFGKVLASTLPNAQFPYWDSFNMVFGFIEKWLLMNKKLERWPLGIVRVIIYAITLYNVGAIMLCVLHLIQAILGMYGYITWRKSYLSN